MTALKASLGTLASGLLGVALVGHAYAAVPAPVPAPASTSEPTPDSRPDPDACQLLSNLDLEPLLFAGVGGALDSDTEHPAPGLSTCAWAAHPRDRAADAPPRTATLAFYHLADAARAKEQFARQNLDIDTRPSTALVDTGTGIGDDAVAHGRAVAVAVARHGADLAVFDARGAELDNLDQPEVRYDLDMLALKAAGAAVRSPPWARPGQTARWIPLGGANVAQRTVAGWAPPLHPAPARAAVLAPLLHALRLVTAAGTGPWLSFLITPLVLLVLGWLRFRDPIRARLGLRALPPKPPTLWPLWLAIALVGIVSLLGRGFATTLINEYGVDGAAIVTGSVDTHDQYNRHDVFRRDIDLRTVDGRVVSTHFRTDDFNVENADDVDMPDDESGYPEPGDIFTVRYLAGYPADFVILGNDDSPWAHKLACARLAQRHQQSNLQTVAAPSDAQRRAEAARAATLDTLTCGGSTTSPAP